MAQGVVKAIGEMRVSGFQACIAWIVKENATLCIGSDRITVEHPTAGRHVAYFGYPDGVFTAVETCVNRAYDYLRDKKVKVYSARMVARPNQNISIQVGKGTKPRKPAPKIALSPQYAHV